MFLNDTTRENARALLGAAVTGSAVGLILAGAYLGGGLARSAQQQAMMPVSDAQAVQTADAANSIPAAVNRQGARSGELLKASLAGSPGPAAKPFRSRSQSDLECLTEAIYYEARGEGPTGQAAVAQVVLNRVRHPSFPKSVCAVVYQGCQFSFACDGSTRRGKETGAWNRARRIASQALAGAVVANVGNATHFHTIHVAPQWGPNLLRVGQVGLHVFYRFSGRNGRPGAFTAEPQSTDKPEPGLFEYARLTPEEAVKLVGAKVTPAVVVTPAPGVGGPAGPVSEPASAPIATAAEAVAQPASAETTVKSSAQPTAATAS